MSYETKALLVALLRIARKADSIEEICEAIIEMANSEVLILQPLSDEHHNRAVDDAADLRMAREIVNSTNDVETIKLKLEELIQSRTSDRR